MNQQLVPGTSVKRTEFFPKSLPLKRICHHKKFQQSGMIGGIKLFFLISPRNKSCGYVVPWRGNSYKYEQHINL